MVNYACVLLFFSALFADCTAMRMETRKQSLQKVTCCAVPKDKYSQFRDGFGFASVAGREVNLAGLVYNKDLETLAVYLKTNDINAQVNCYGEALLHLAVRYRHIDVVAWLLKQPNIDPDVRMHNEGASLHAALIHGFFPETVEIIRLLVAARASVRLENMCRRSALNIAQYKAMFNARERKLLIEELKKAHDIGDERACNNLGAAIEQELARERERLAQKENQKARRMVQQMMLRTRLATVDDEEPTVDAGDLQRMVAFTQELEQQPIRRNALRQCRMPSILRGSSSMSAAEQALQVKKGEQVFAEAVVEEQIPTPRHRRRRATAPQGSSPLVKCNLAKTEEGNGSALDDASGEPVYQDALGLSGCQIEIFTEACAAPYDSSMLPYPQSPLPDDEGGQISNYVDDWYGLGLSGCDTTFPDFLMSDQSKAPAVQ